MATEKLQAAANRHNLKFDLDQFAKDWADGRDEKEMMKHYNVSGQQMRDLVIDGGLGARYPHNDPRVKPEDAAKAAGAAKNTAATLADHEARLAALESKSAS